MKRLLIVVALIAVAGACSRAPASTESASEDAPQLGTAPDLSIQRTESSAAPGVRSYAVVRAPDGYVAPAPALTAPALAAGTLRGSVLDVLGAPVERVCVRMADAVTDNVVAEDLTDAAGRYALASVPSRYEVHVDAACGPGAGVFTSAAYDGIVDLREVGAEDVDVVLQRKGRITGTVTDLFDVPLTGACVELDGPEDMELDTDAGAFDRALDAGDYTVTFSVCGLPSGAIEYNVETVSVTISPGETTPLDASLTPIV